MKLVVIEILKLQTHTDHSNHLKDEQNNFQNFRQKSSCLQIFVHDDKAM